VLSPASLLPKPERTQSSPCVAVAVLRNWTHSSNVLGCRYAAVAAVNDIRAVEAALEHSLGFSLTNAQSQALSEVLVDMSRNAAMFR
jgi:hypothetical protein